MLDAALADDLAGDELADGYLRPDYDGFCFARVPATAASLVGADLGRGLPERALDGVTADAERVVVVFLDSLGFRQFERVHGDVSLLSSFVDEGRVTPLTSTFPSETAACVTTMHTATDPVEHGMLGWNGYDPEGDVVYETLPYAAKDGGEVSVAPGDLFDADSVYGDLGAAGVDAHVVEPDYGPGYRDASTAGATVHHYERTMGFALAVRDAVRESAAPSYTYAYYPVVDSVAHREGPDGEAYDLQVAAVCDALERAFATVDGDVSAETAVCLVADHGQVPVERRTELDETGVLEYVPTDRSGTPLVLGGPRNVHLRVSDTEAARACLAAADLDALVRSKADALADDLWGFGEPGPAFERNCGDLLVVPREGALWRASEPEELALAGMHGGLHEREALVPFGVARLGDLV
ncbi:alkaline phosphatase family protein [Halobacterium yunchengense]|uniref:alkaline phosphatase family protein n=1 Tax=Halobacterium yunchengense TaxID=3108497 RepID=UPI00300B7131